MNYECLIGAPLAMGDIVHRVIRGGEEGEGRGSLFTSCESPTLLLQ